MEIAQFLKADNFQSYEQTEFYEKTGNTNVDSLNTIATKEFETIDREIIYAVADSFLQINGKIVKSNNDPINTKLYKTTVVNSILSLFKSVKYTMNTSIIDEYDEPGLIHHIRGIHEYSDDYSHGQGKLSGWALDKGTGLFNPSKVISLLNLTTGASDDLGALEVATATDLTAVIGSANTDSLVLVYDNEYVKVVVNGVIKQLHCVTDHLDKITFTTAVVNGSVVTFYVKGKRLRVYNSLGAEATFSSNNNRIQITSGEAVAIAAGELYGVLDDDEYENEGFEERRLRHVIETSYNTSKNGNYMIPVREFIPYLRYNPLPLLGVTHNLRFVKNDENNILYQNSNDANKFRFTRLCWMIPKVVYKPEIEILYLNHLSSINKFNWYSYRLAVKPSSQEKASTYPMVTALNSIPRKVYIMFQRTAKTDNYMENNRLFDHMDLEHIEVICGGVTYPNVQLDVNYGLGTEIANKDYIRAYQIFLSSCGATHSNDCLPSITYDEFKNLYPIYSFTLHTNKPLYEFNANTSLQVKYRIRTTIPDPYKIYMFYEMPCSVNINVANQRITRVDKRMD